MPGKIWAIFAIIAVLALCGCAEQGTQNQTTPEIPPATPEIPPAEEVGGIEQPRRQVTETGAAEEQAEGNVSAVDVENSTITISTAEGEELVLSVIESSRITRDEVEELGMGSAGLEQIAEGDQVSVVYNPETMEAISIDLLSAEAQLAPPEALEIQPPEEEVPEPVEEPVPEVPEIQPPEEPVPEEPAEEPGAPEQVPGFEAYLALGAIGLAGAAVALAHRKKKE